MLPSNRSALRRTVRVLLFSDIRRVQNGCQVGFSTECLSRVLRTEPVASNHKDSKPYSWYWRGLRRIRLSSLCATGYTHSPWLGCNTKSITAVAEIFTGEPIIAEAITLPWPYAYLESYTGSAPPIARLLSWGLRSLQRKAIWVHLFPGLPHPIRSTFRLSQPLSGLLLKTPWSPITYF